MIVKRQIVHDLAYWHLSLDLLSRCENWEQWWNKDYNQRETYFF